MPGDGRAVHRPETARLEGLPRSGRACNVPEHRTGQLMPSRSGPASASVAPARASDARRRVRLLVLLPVFATSSVATAHADAQGISSAGVNGTVRSERGEPIDGARVLVRNTATGYWQETTTRGGIFYARGLEVGGPYQITVRALGYTPRARDSVFLRLGDPESLEFVLAPAAQSLERVLVSAETSNLRSAQTGPSTTIPGSLLHGLPSLNRDMYDFVRLVPQVSARLNGVSGGTNFRLNGYLIDGVSDRQLGSNSVMGGARGGKSMPVDALKEYQVLLSPYDARYGDFAGLLVNAVTKHGTNTLEGSAFGYMRNDRLARSGGFLAGSAYERWQYGVSLGGPVIRDRVHFFAASEFQDHAEPALGPYLGQEDDASAAVPVSPESVDRFVSLLRARGLDPGHGGRVTAVNPVAAFFGRVDISVPEWKSRLALRYTYSDVARTQFGRLTPGRFPLSSNAWSLQLTKRSAALQLFTQPAGRLFNELLIGYSTVPNGASRYMYAPTVSVSVPNVAGGTAATLVAGPPDMGQGTHIVNTSVEVADHLSFQLDDQHAISVGVRSEWLRYNGNRVPGSFGRWMFANLDALERGEARTYGLARDFGSASTPLNGVQLGAYVNDEWRLTQRLMITSGVRADLLTLDARPGYNAGIETVLGRRTTDFPRSMLHWSPRLGLSWESGGQQRTRVRGGIGLFAGRPPLGWLRSPLRQYGMGIRSLVCTAVAGAPTSVPDFNPDPEFQPTACANGVSYSSGHVDLVDRHLRMGEALRTSFAVDRELPWDLVATAEAIYTRNRSDFMLVNMKLRGPQGFDRHGRVMYGTIEPTGARPAIVAGTDTVPEVIDLRNQSRNYSWSLTGQLSKRFSSGLEARGSYTYAVMRDVQSLVENTAGNQVNESWAGSRVLSGRHDDLSPTISSFDVPHRFVLAAVYAAPWKRWATDVALTYIGESGVRYTYLDSSTAAGFGDLNADGTSANDPIYVPRDASDPAEILFTGDAGAVQRQQVAFERFITNTPCLRRQRGRIVERNSCLAPWVHSAHISVRQALPQLSNHRLALQLDVFNVLNLLNSSWGLVRVPNVNVLEHVEQTAGALDASRSIFRFNPAVRRFSTANAESSYQIQVAARYSF